MKTSASPLSSPRELAVTRRSATAERLLAAIGGSPTRTGGGGGWENHTLAR